MYKSLVMGAVAQQFLSLAIILLVTRLLGAEGYGEIVTLTAVATTTFCFSAQWAVPYMVRTESVNYSKTHKIGSAFFIPILISLCILLVVTYLITHNFSDMFGGYGAIPAPMIYISALGQFIFQMAKTGLQIQGRFSYYGTILWLDKAILLIIIGGLFLFNLLTVISVLWAYVAGVMLAGLVGLGVCLNRRIDWANDSFLFEDYVKSVAPISASVAILYFSSIAFLTLIGREAGGAQFAAWLGIGSVLLGVLLQPFSWLTPILAPKLSKDVLEANGHARISSFLQNWMLPSNLIILWVAVCTATLILVTPILSLLFGNGFQGGAAVVALVILLAAAEAGNMLLVQIAYARKLETLVMVAVLLKAMPLLIGYAFDASLEINLVLLNLGSWLLIGISLLGIRSYLERKWVLQYAALGVTALLVSVMVVMPHGKWFLGGILIVISLPAIRFLQQMLRMVGLGVLQPKTEISSLGYKSPMQLLRDLEEINTGSMNLQTKNFGANINVKSSKKT